MVEVKVTCDRCKRQIRLDRENFFQVTVQQKDVKPDGTIFSIDEWSRVICEDCQAVLNSPDAEEREKTEAAVKEETPAPEEAEETVPEKKPAKEKKQAAVPEKKPEKEKPEAAVEEVAPVQLTEGGRKKKVDPVLVKVLLKKGWSQTKIAKEMGVTPGAISQIAKKYKESEE